MKPRTTLSPYFRAYEKLCAKFLHGLEVTEGDMSELENSEDLEQRAKFIRLDYELRDIINYLLFKIERGLGNTLVILGGYPQTFFFLRDICEIHDEKTVTINVKNNRHPQTQKVLNDNAQIEPPYAEQLIKFFEEIRTTFPERMKGIDLISFCMEMILALVEHKPNDKWMKEVKAYNEYAKIIKKKNPSNAVTAPKATQDQQVSNEPFTAQVSNKPLTAQVSDKKVTASQFIEKYQEIMDITATEFLKIFNDFGLIPGTSVKFDSIEAIHKGHMSGVYAQDDAHNHTAQMTAGRNIFIIALLMEANCSSETIDLQFNSKAILKNNLDLVLDIQFADKYSLKVFLNHWLKEAWSGKFPILSPIISYSVHERTRDEVQAGLPKYVLQVTMDPRVLEYRGRIPWCEYFRRYGLAYLRGGSIGSMLRDVEEERHSDPGYAHDLDPHPSVFRELLKKSLGAQPEDSELSIDDLITLFISSMLNGAITNNPSTDYFSSTWKMLILYKLKTKRFNTQVPDGRYPCIELDIPDAHTFGMIMKLLSSFLSNDYPLPEYKGPHKKYSFCLKRNKRLFDELTKYYISIKDKLRIYTRILKDDRDDPYQRLLQRLAYVATLKLNTEMNALDPNPIKLNPKNSPWQLIADFISKGLENKLKQKIGEIGACGRFDRSHVYMTFPNSSAETMTYLLELFPPENGVLDNSKTNRSNKTIVINNNHIYSIMKRFFESVLNDKINSNKNEFQLKRICFLLGLTESELRKKNELFLQLFLTFFKVNAKLENATFATWKYDEKFTALTLNINETTVLLKLVSELRKFAEDNFCGNGSDLVFLASHPDGSLQLCVHTTLLFNKVLDRMETIIPVLLYESKFTINKDHFIYPSLCDINAVAAAFSKELNVTLSAQSVLEHVIKHLELFTYVGSNTLFRSATTHENKNCLVLYLHDYSSDKTKKITQQTAIDYIKQQLPNLILGVTCDTTGKVIAYIIDNAKLVQNFVPMCAKQLTAFSQIDVADKFIEVLNVPPNAVKSSEESATAAETAILELAGVESTQKGATFKADPYDAKRTIFKFIGLHWKDFDKVINFYQKTFPGLDVGFNTYVGKGSPDLPQYSTLSMYTSGLMIWVMPELRKVPNRWRHKELMTALALKLEVPLDKILNTDLVESMLVKRAGIEYSNKNNMNKFRPYSSTETYFILDLKNDERTKFIDYWNKRFPRLNIRQGVGKDQDKIILNTDAFLETVVPILENRASSATSTPSFFQPNSQRPAAADNPTNPIHYNPNR